LSVEGIGSNQQNRQRVPSEASADSHMYRRKTVHDAALSFPFTRNDILDLASSDADSRHHRLLSMRLDA